MRSLLPAHESDRQYSPIPMHVREAALHDESSDDSDSDSADYNSGDSDDIVLAVSGPSGTWLVTQVSGPKEELPKPVQVLQHLHQDLHQ